MPWKRNYMHAHSLQSTHEIISEECDLFRVRIRPRHQLIKFPAFLYIFLVTAVIICALKVEVVEWGLVAAIVLTGLFTYISLKIQEGIFLS